MQSNRISGVMKTLFRIIVVVAVLVPVAGFAQANTGGSSSGVVYVMTNRAEGNSVQVFQRGSDGSLSFVQEVATQGMGTGVTADPLMSQGSPALSPDGKLLLAVNAASGDLTSFVVSASGLTFASRVPSGGALPVSVTVRGHIVYVLNQLGIANIAGFLVDATGRLHALPHSGRPLVGAALAQPGQISFTPDGTRLLVTEKGTDQIDIFEVQGDGLTRGPTVAASSGKTPFGFAFAGLRTLVVSEVERRLPNQATASSYQLGSGSLTPVSRAVPDTQSGACWVTVTNQVAWVVNTGTANISAYEVGSDGRLTLLDAMAASTGMGSTPIDLAASSDGQYLYVLQSALGGIAGFKISGSTLTPLFSQTGLPLSIQGIAVR